MPEHRAAERPADERSTAWAGTGRRSNLNQKCERLWILLGTAERSELNYAKQKARWRKQPARLHRPSCRSGNSLTTASRQGDKSTTSDYEARQSRAHDRTGHGLGRHRSEQDIPDCRLEGVEIEERDHMRNFVGSRQKLRETACR